MGKGLMGNMRSFHASKACFFIFGRLLMEGGIEDSKCDSKSF